MRALRPFENKKESLFLKGKYKDCVDNTLKIIQIWSFFKKSFHWMVYMNLYIDVYCCFRLNCFVCLFFLFYFQVLNFFFATCNYHQINAELLFFLKLDMTNIFFISVDNSCIWLFKVCISWLEKWRIFENE